VEELLESGPEQLSTCRHVESPSLKSLNRAIEQVRALFDLARPHAGAEAISPGLALSVLEGLVRRALPTITSSADASSIDECDQSLQAMEELLGRVDELHAHPSIQTVESVWMIQQYQWQRTSGTSCDPSNKSRQAKQLDRTIALLRNWTIWSCFSGMALSGRPPPPLFLLKVLQTASQAGLVMTDQLWDLVERLILNETPRQLCRDVHSQLLDVLSYSGSRWDHYQCRVLQRMLRYSIDDERDHSSRASIAKLLIRAMRASSQAGRVPDTAWLARQLLCLNCTFAEGDPTFNEEAIRMLFLKSLQYSDDPGSLLYMERLVLTDRDDSFPLSSNTLKMVLQKCAVTRAPDSGPRAERTLFRAVQKINQTDWRPDVECVESVVEAHLLGNTSLPSVRLADAFLRQFVRKFGLHAHGNDTVRVFERILQAYCVAAMNDLPKTFQCADELFRFFLVNHRKGRVTVETPDWRHLEIWTNLWSRCNESSFGSGGDRLAEYQQIIRDLDTTGRELCRP
jgi:hypothetical protein